MLKAFAFGLLLVSISAVGWPPPASGQDNPAAPKKKPEVSTVQVSVTRSDTANPVSGADVTAQWGDGGDSDSRNTTTGTKGLAKFDAIPRGKVELVVLARKFCTFRHSYDIKKADESIEVKLHENKDGCP